MKEVSNIDKYFDLARKSCGTLSDTICNGALETVHKSWKKTRGIGNQRKNRNHTDSIFEIS